MEVIKNSVQELHNFSEEQIRVIMNDLTIDNPKYYSALTFSKYSSVKIPKYLYYYDYDPKTNILNVPIGYKIPFDNYIVKDERAIKNVTYPKFLLELRDTQKEAFKNYLSNTDNGLIVLATGKGKTILGLYIAFALRQKVLIIVHKDDLVSGWNNDVKLCFGDNVNSGLIKAKKRIVGEQVTISTIQTLSRMKEEELSKYTNEFGMIIMDECLAKDTLITLNDGGFKTIDKIVNGDNVLGGEVSNAFKRNSEKYVVKTSTTILEGSPTHKTWVWCPTTKSLIERQFKDIKEGDYLPNLITIPHTTKYKWTDKQLSFVALIQTDGHIDKSKGCYRIKLNVSKDFEYYTKVFTEGVKSFGDYEVKKTIDKRGNLSLWVNSKELRSILIDVFEIPAGKKCCSLVINEQIQYSPLDSIKAYIETLFSTEGNLSNTKGSYRINIEMCSKQLIQGLSLLLRKFGIVVNYQEVAKERNNDTYRISAGGRFFNTFMNTFNLLDRKHTKERNIGKLRNCFYFDDYLMTKVTKSYITEEQIEVYDFTTESHSFYANGIKTHNCHHISSTSYDILHLFNAHYKIGLSATPERSDGLTKVMNFHLGDIAYKYEYTLEDTDILPVKVFIQDTEVIYEPKCKRGNKGYVIDDKEGTISLSRLPYNKRPRINFYDLEDKYIFNKKYTGLVIPKIKEMFNKKYSIIIFLSKKEHCRLYKQLLVDNGIPENQIQLYYGDSKDSKEDMKIKAENKEVLITVATYSIATEGTNVKSWEVAFLVSSLNNGKNVEQAVGRIRRSASNKINPVLLFDYSHPKVYSINKHINTRLMRYKQLNFDINFI